MGKQCEYCNDDIFKEVFNFKVDELDNLFGFGKKHDDIITYEGVERYCEIVEYSVVVDRGYLRVVDKEDMACIDHGLGLIEIKHCPMCGKQLND